MAFHLMARSEILDSDTTTGMACRKTRRRWIRIRTHSTAKQLNSRKRKKNFITEVLFKNLIWSLCFFSFAILYSKCTLRSQRTLICNKYRYCYYQYWEYSYLYISLFILRWTLISQRNDNEARLGVIKQDGLVHFRGYIMSKSETVFYVLHVLSKMEKETWNQ